MQPQGDRPVTISFRPQQMIGWMVTLVVCLIPIILWLSMTPISVRFYDLSIGLSSVGKITGIIGIVLYALNLVYSTRLRFLENWFGGLNRVYIAHHVVGGLALIFLCIHPLFLSLGLIKSSLYEAAMQLIPNGLSPVSALFDSNHEFHVEVLEQWALFFGIIAFWGMVGLLIITFFVKLPYRLWLFTHKFLGLAFFLAGLHVLLISSDTSRNALLRYYVIGLSILGLGAFIYKSLLGKILIRKYKYYVDKVQTVGGNVTQLELRPVDLPITYQPGQFVFVRFLYSGADKVTAEWHPFSISSAPHEQNLRLSIKALGDYTKAMPQLKPGAIAEVEGAYGKFSFKGFKNPNQIWIAGGIGITPFLSMAKSLPSSGYKIDLYYSVKTISELINFNELVAVHELNKECFRFIPYVADKKPQLLNADFIEKTSQGLQSKEIFICGPPPMMKALKKQLKDKQVLSSVIHTEEFAMS